MGVTISHNRVRARSGNWLEEKWCCEKPRLGSTLVASNYDFVISCFTEHCFLSQNFSDSRHHAWHHSVWQSVTEKYRGFTVVGHVQGFHMTDVVTSITLVTICHWFWEWSHGKWLFMMFQVVPSGPVLKTGNGPGTGPDCDWCDWTSSHGYTAST